MKCDRSVGVILEVTFWSFRHFRLKTFWSFRHFRAKTFWSFRQNDYFYVKNKQIAQLWKEEYSDARYTTRLRNGNHGQMVS